VGEGAGACLGELHQAELLQELEGAAAIVAPDRSADDRAPRLLDGDDEVLDERQVGKDPRLLKGSRQTGAVEANRIRTADAASDGTIPRGSSTSTRTNTPA